MGWLEYRNYFNSYIPKLNNERLTKNPTEIIHFDSIRIELSKKSLNIEFNYIFLKKSLKALLKKEKE